MIINKLELTHFRNYEKRNFKFGTNANVIVGPNGIGKTNILEAISYASRGKSFRSLSEYEAIQFEQNFSRIDIETFYSKDKNTEDLNLFSVVLQKKLPTNRIKKTFLINKVENKSVDFVGKIKTVLFTPEDLRLINGSPTRRRNYLDGLLSQVYTEYYKTHLKYERILKQRNKLLEQIAIERSGSLMLELEIWDRQLVEVSEIIHKYRDEFFQYITEKIHQLSDSLFQNGLTLKAEYSASYLTLDKLNNLRNLEINTGSTKSGPHRDDFSIYLCGLKADAESSQMNLKEYGSRGQQRTGVLALKILERDFIELKTNLKPILLLDDIFSELDEHYRYDVAESLDGAQFFITTADIRNVPQVILDGANVINLSEK